MVNFVSRVLIQEMLFQWSTTSDRWGYWMRAWHCTISLARLLVQSEQSMVESMVVHLHPQALELMKKCGDARYSGHVAFRLWSPVDDSIHAEASPSYIKHNPRRNGLQSLIFVNWIEASTGFFRGKISSRFILHKKPCCDEHATVHKVFGIFKVDLIIA